MKTGELVVAAYVSEGGSTGWNNRAQVTQLAKCPREWEHYQPVGIAGRNQRYTVNGNARGQREGGRPRHSRPVP